MSLVEQELLTLPDHLSSPPGFSGVRVTLSLVLYICLVDRCLTLCTFFYMDEFAYKSSNTRKANQFSWKIIHNTIYTEAKLKKKIGSMNGLCHFFYILELKFGNIYFTTTVIQQNHIGVKKLHDSPLSTHH